MSGVGTFRCCLAFALNQLPEVAEMFITSGFVPPPGNNSWGGVFDTKLPEFLDYHLYISSCWSPFMLVKLNCKLGSSRAGSLLDQTSLQENNYSWHNCVASASPIAQPCTLGHTKTMGQIFHNCFKSEVYKPVFISTINTSYCLGKEVLNCKLCLYSD